MTTTPPDDLMVRLRATRFVPAIIRRVAWFIPKLINPDGPEAADRIERQDEALKLAIGHIEHMAAYITRGQSRAVTPYSFESLGEDMPTIKAALEDTNHG